MLTQSRCCCGTMPVQRQEPPQHTACVLRSCSAVGVHSWVVNRTTTCSHCYFRDTDHRVADLIQDELHMQA